MTDDRVLSAIVVQAVLLLQLVVQCAIQFSLYISIIHYSPFQLPTTNYNPEQVNPKLGFDAASTFLHKLTLCFPFCPKMLIFLVSNP